MRLRGLWILLAVAGPGVSGKHPAWDKMPLREDDGVELRPGSMDEESRLATLSNGEGEGDSGVAATTGGQKASGGTDFQLKNNS